MFRLGFRCVFVQDVTLKYPLPYIVIARLEKAEAIQSDNKASLLTGFSGQAPK